MPNNPEIPPHILPAFGVGVRSYNGVAFPPAVETKVQIEPVYDSSGRAPKWWKHSFTIEFLLTPHTNPQGDLSGLEPVDANFETIKRYLQIPGGELTFSFNGLGTTNQRTFDVGEIQNSQNYYRVNRTNDLNFGPKPVLLTWEQVGSCRAVRVQWSVEFFLSVCCWADINNDSICDNVSNGVLTPSQVSFTEFNYSISFEIDEEGWSRRTLVGSAEVRGQFLIVPNNSDYGNTQGFGPSPVPNASIQIPLNVVQDKISALFFRLPGFHRSFAWDVSRDGRRVDWRITDTEIHSDEPYINGIMKCDVRHAMNARFPFFKWANTISGSFTPQPGVPKSLAWTAFLMVVRSRLLAFQLAGDNGASSPALLEEYTKNGEAAKLRVHTPCYLPTSISVEENIYSREVSFSLGFTAFCHFNTIMLASRMFMPVGGTDWTLWQTTMSPALLTGRGLSNIYSGGNSNIVVQCTQPTEPSNNASANYKFKPLSIQELFQMKCPDDKSKTWLDYKLWFQFEDQASVAVMQKSFKTPEEYAYDVGSYIGEASKRIVTGDSIPAAGRDKKLISPTQRKVVQNTSDTRFRVIMHGYGLRLCHDVPIPDLLQVGDSVNPINVNNVVTPSYRIGSHGPVPMYAGRWSRTYEFVGQPPAGITKENVKLSDIPEDFLDKINCGSVTAFVPGQQ